MRYGTPQDRVGYWLFGDKIPVTKLVIISNLVTLLAMVMARASVIPQYLAFESFALLAKPWSIFTYPAVARMSMFTLLFSGFWMWIAGGSLERSWGSRRFGYFFFGIAGISAIGLFIGSILAGVPMTEYGLWLPLAGVTMAFAMRSPEDQVLFGFVIPLKLKYLALIDILFVLVHYGSRSPLVGIFALLGCAAAYLYVRPVRIRRSVRRVDLDEDVIRVRPKHSVRRSLNPLKRLREHREEKRLKDLFSRSDPDD